jgi:peptidyl-prolyl cis-trans isomerase D
MLQSIRDRTQGWIAGIIISLVILSFALWGIHSYLVGATDTSVIAKVNGVLISKSQFASAYERLHRQAQMNMGAISETNEADLKLRALQTLINIQVLKQASLAEKYRVSSRQVNNFLESMPEFQVDGQFSLNRFQQLLSATAFTAGDFLDLLESTLLIDQPRLGIMLSSIALPDEVKETIALVNQERDISYLNVTRDLFLKQNISIAEQDIAAYYNQHQNEFKAPEQIAIEYVLLSVKDLMDDLHPSDEAMKAFYNENLNAYTQPMQWSLQKVFIPLANNAPESDVAAAQKKADDTLQKIRKGQDFAAVAHEFSQNDDELKLSTWMTLNQLPADLQKPLSTLTHAGQLTEPVRLKNGIVILKAIAVKEAVVKPFAEVTDKVQEALSRQLAEEKFAEAREKLANTTYEYPDSLQPVVKSLGLAIQSTGLFTKEKGNDNDISANKKVRDAGFNVDVLNSKNNSDVIQINPDAAIVLRIKSHVPAAILSLNAVKSQIIDKLKTAKAETQSLQLAEELIKKLKQGEDAEKLLQQYNLAWNKLGFIGRYSTKVDSAILYTAFRITRPKKDAMPTYVTVKVPNGYTVVTVKAVRDGSIKEGQDQYDIFSDQVQNSEGLLEYKLYETSLAKAAKIVIENPQQGPIEE